jgi:stage II sporulation protein D
MSFARKRRSRWNGKLPGKAIVVGMLAGLLVLAGCLMIPTETAVVGGPKLRVLILNDVERVAVSVDGIARDYFNLAQPVEVASARAEPIGVGEKRFRGDIRLVPQAEGRFDVVNVLTAEEYLMGVVTRESPASWPADALKAQAIAARTYALYNARVRMDASRHFDLFADVKSQVYGGVEGETEAGRRAVAETEGVVVAWGPAGRERIFEAYFSSTCGGITASAADVFPEDDIPPLHERLADGCRIAPSPRYSWELIYSKAELQQRIADWGRREGHAIGQLTRLKSMSIAKSNALGRPTAYELVDASGRKFVLSSEQTRWAIGFGLPSNQKPPSGFFKPVDAGESIRLSEGHGFGHGVGMCQWCACGWSRRGDNFRDILLRSYPGAVLIKAY